MSEGRILLADTAATERVGAALAPLLREHPGGMIHLEGELGAGKTTLSRALLRALGVQGAVKSPTYTLVEPYEVAGLRVLHLDLYRLADPEELYGLGVLDEAPPAAWWLVEWPQRGGALLPAADVALRLQHLDGARRLHWWMAAEFAASPVAGELRRLL